MVGVEKIFDRGFLMNLIGFFDVYMIIVGIVVLILSDIEVLVKYDKEKNIYRKIYFKNGRVVGFMFINLIDRVGMIINMIKEGFNVESIKYRFFEEDFGYLDLLKEIR